MRYLTILLLLTATHASAQTLKLATVAPEGSVWFNALEAMREDWQRISSGAIDVRIYPAGVAGDDAMMIRKMRIGQLNGAALTANGMASIATEMRIFQMPLLIRDDAELDYLRNRLARQLEDLAAAQGFKVLAWSDIGWVYLFSKQPVVSSDAARSLRLWVDAGDTSWSQTLKSSGYQPVALPATEILTGLQSGLIDAFDAPPVVALSSQWFGLAPHMMDLRWAPFVGAVVVTDRFWSQVPPDQRDALQTAARNATADAQAKVRQFEQGAIEAMQQHGLTVHEVSAENARRFEQEIQAAYPQIVGSSIPAPIYHEARSLLDEYRRSQ